MTRVMRDTMIEAGLQEWKARAAAKVETSATEHVTAVIDAALAAIDSGSDEQRVLWAAAGRLLPQLRIRLAAIAGSGCEAGAQRSYLRGQYDLLTRDLWEALGLVVPPEFATINASTEGRGDKMLGEPEEPTTDETAEATAEDGGADAAAEESESEAE